MIIEFKQDSPILFNEVIRLLTESGPERYKNVFWFSLLGPINSKLHKLEPRIPTITSVPKMLHILACYYIGLLPFISIEDGVFGITIDEVREYSYFIDLFDVVILFNNASAYKIFYFVLLKISLKKIREEKSLAGAPVCKTH
jgi:hypothetical protein